MNNPDRLRRKDPERKGPIRNPTTYFRDSKSWKERESPTAQSPSQWAGLSDSLDDAVTHGVKLGYEVIEKYLRQGQQVAETMQNAFPQNSPYEENWEKVVGDIMRLSRDMSGLWIDAIDLLMEGPEFFSKLTRPKQTDHEGVQPNKTPDSNIPMNGANRKLAIEIACKRRTRVILDIRRSPDQAVLHIHALHPPDPTIPPLTNISFLREGDSGIPVLRLNIPEKQPAGIYTGAVVDQKSNEALGTVCVSILT